MNHRPVRYTLWHVITVAWIKAGDWCQCVGSQDDRGADTRLVACSHGRDGLSEALALLHTYLHYLSHRPYVSIVSHAPLIYISPSATVAPTQDHNPGPRNDEASHMRHLTAPPQLMSALLSVGPGAGRRQAQE